MTKGFKKGVDMRVSAISQTNYVKTRNVKTQALPKRNENVSFQGVKGIFAGGATGAALAAGFTAITGGAGLVVLPMWTFIGGVLGHFMDEENKTEVKEDKPVEEKKNLKKDKDDYEYSKYTDTSGFDPSYEESFTRF